MTQAMLDAELAGLIEGLSHVQKVQLLRIARSMTAPIDVDINFPAGLITVDFEREFTARLQAHHGTHSKQLDRISFEDAFRASSVAAGRTVHGLLAATNRFYDEVVDGESWALKTTAAKDVRKSFVHISKLSEAAWIQDVRGAAARAKSAKDQIAAYLSKVDRLVQLRVLPDRESWVYELVEVPMGLFTPIADLEVREFDSDGPRILVKDVLGACLTLVLDRSDSKITISRIPIERCIVHGQWELPKSRSI